ncbi:MAG TPA: tripartite tricarboxylate transporter substrate binding protein [Xanthobacteraceae bacterium]
MTTGLSATLVPALLRGASAQEWPTRFVRLIVPFPPGGGTDAVARIVTTKLSELWGQQVVIENRGGAGSNIGNEAAARAEGDGYTMLFGTLPLAVNRFIYASLPYDPIADLAPVSMLCRYPNLMAVPNSSHVKSVQEFIAHAKMNPGLTFGSSGIGTSPHLCGELFKRMAGLTMTHVPYRGAGPALNDLIPGRIDMMFNTMGAMLPQVRSGQIRGLAVTTAERFFTAPELPTIAESGVPGFDVTGWYALFVPARTPVEIVRRMNADAVEALRDPVVKKRLEDLGVQVVSSTRDALTVQLQAEMNKWEPIVKAAGISAQ